MLHQTHVSRLKKSPTGFTLVELLVVVGIIALLIAILLPALNKARAQAVTIACNAKLRQLSLACVMYAGDNRGSMPPTAASGFNASYGRPNIFPAGGTCYLTKYLSREITPNASNQNIGAITDAAKLYVCPALDSDATAKLNGYSYKYNGYVGGAERYYPDPIGAPGSWVGKPWKIAQIHQSSNVALWTEGQFSGSIGRNMRFLREPYNQHSITGAENFFMHSRRMTGGTWKAYWANVFYPNVTGTANIGFADGSVRSIPTVINKSPMTPWPDVYIDPSYPMNSW